MSPPAKSAAASSTASPSANPDQITNSTSHTFYKRAGQERCMQKRLAGLNASGLPGRWLGAASLIVGPLLLLTGILLRIQFHFFFPQQLAAYHDHPPLITAAY